MTFLDLIVLSAVGFWLTVLVVSIGLGLIARYVWQGLVSIWQSGRKARERREEMADWAQESKGAHRW